MTKGRAFDWSGGLAIAGGLAVWWGLLGGALDLALVRDVSFENGLVRLRYLCAAALLQAVPSLAVGLGIWLTWRLWSRQRAGMRRELVGTLAVQVAAMLVPIALGATAVAHAHLPAQMTVFSLPGLGVTAAVLALAIAIGVGATLVLARVLKPVARVSLRTFRALGLAGWGTAALAIPVMLVNHSPAGGSVPGRPNVLLISIDSVRKDIWDEYLEKHASAVLRGFVEGALRFEWAHTTFSHSLPSHASMFSGLYPPEHGAITFLGGQLGSPIDPERELLAERFSAAGYETAGVMSNAWIGPPYGLETGFQTYLNYGRARRLGSFNQLLTRTVSTVGYYLHYADRHFASDLHPNSRLFLSWLRSRESSRPFFAFLHYIEMHVPNSPPPRYAKRFATGPFADWGGYQLEMAIRAGEIERHEIDRALEQVHALNLASLAQMDDFISPVLQALDEDGFLETTLVILTSDHGDNLYEKAGTYGHSHVYNTIARVPLLIRVPGQARGSERRDLASVVDFAATAYAFAGISPPEGIRGVDLLTPDARATNPDPWIYVQGGDHDNDGWARATIRTDGYKCIVDAADTVEIYNVLRDPRELRDLSKTRDDLRRELRHRFDLAVASMSEVEANPLGIESLPSDVADQLRALGYIE